MTLSRCGLTLAALCFSALFSRTAAADQADDGAKLFAANCAKCHGDAGQGKKDAPPLVGKDALPLDPPASAKHRKVKFKTALDVFQFVKANMPPKKAGTLTDAEYVAILAFDLKANGVDLKGKPLDAKVAESLVLHP